MPSTLMGGFILEHPSNDTPHNSTHRWRRPTWGWLPGHCIEMTREREEILCRNNKTNPSERPSSALSLHSVWVFRYVFFLQPSTKRALSNYLHILFHSLLPLKEVFLRWPLKAIQARRPKTHQKTSFADALCASWLLPGVDPKTSLAKGRTLEENTHEERDRNW